MVVKTQASFAQRLERLKSVQEVWMEMDALGFNEDAWHVYGLYGNSLGLDGWGEKYTEARPITLESAQGVLQFLYLTQPAPGYDYYAYMWENDETNGSLILNVEFTGEELMPGKVEDFNLIFPDNISITWETNAGEFRYTAHRYLIIASLVQAGYVQWADLREGAVSHVA